MHGVMSWIMWVVKDAFPLFYHVYHLPNLNSNLHLRIMWDALYIPYRQRGNHETDPNSTSG